MLVDDLGVAAKTTIPNLPGIQHPIAHTLLTDLYQFILRNAGN
jgi:hypothetical protein